MLERTIAVAWAASVILSWKLWCSSRIFPLSPVAGFLPRIPSSLDAICAGALVAMLAAIAIFPRSRTLIAASLALAGLLALGDQTRWQPWFYQYFFMLVAIGFYGAQGLKTCGVIVASTYFWSGVQKLNANFIREAWPDIAGPFLRKTLGTAAVPAWLIFLIPAAEILIGIGLIGRRFRNAAVWMAVATHAMILALLVSSGENTVVWPWNLAMAAFVATLFWRDGKTSPAGILIPKAAFQWLAFLLFAVMPSFSLIGAWDSYLSSALYSGATYQGVVLVSPAVIDRLPAPLDPHIWRESKPFFLDINRWAYDELNVPVYPEPRIYKVVAREVCKYAEGSPDVRLLILDRPNLLTGRRRREYYDCEHL